MNLYDLTEEMEKIGYEPDDARARVCQDIVLKALSLSSLSRNATIKGGVVMRSITNEVRRATQDMDIDFIRYSLADESIDLFIEKLNTIDGISITRVGDITEKEYLYTLRIISIIPSKARLIWEYINILILSRKNTVLISHLIMRERHFL